MQLEICTTHLPTAILAGEFNIDRIELCSALSLGGLTPSFGLIKACVEQSKCEIHVMIRHKTGDFVYSSEDIEIMTEDIKMAKKAGAKGVVFGCLKANNEIDLQQTEFLTKLAKQLDLKVTFHRAFDFVKNSIQTLEALIQIGVDRVLTSGGSATAEDGIELIRSLLTAAKNRIEIMAGSGINSHNSHLFKTINVDAIHFSGDLIAPDNKKFEMGNNTTVHTSKIRDIIKLYKS